MGEEMVNDAIYEFQTYDLQEIGVIKPKVRVKLSSGFVKRFKEIVGDAARIMTSMDNTMYFDTADFFDRNVIHDTIKKAAINKILREGTPRREYHIVLDEEDVDFGGIEKETEKVRKARKLLDEIEKEKKRLEDSKVIRSFYSNSIVLVDGTSYDTYSYSIEKLEKILEELRNVDPNQVLRNTIEKQRKEIEELERRIRELRAENEELRDRLEDDEEDCWEDDEDDEDEEDEDYW